MGGANNYDAGMFLCKLACCGREGRASAWLLTLTVDPLTNLMLNSNALQAEWLGERVATVDVDRAISNVILGKEDAGWGPNAVFR